MIIIPAIDLRDGRCVRLTQGLKNTTKTYDGDSVTIAKSYEAAGAKMLHIVDLDGAFSDPNSRNRQVLASIIRGVDIPVQFGGGVRTGNDIQNLVELGVTRIVLGTIAVESPEILRAALARFGKRRFAIGIDARSGSVVTRGWEKQEELSPLTLAVKVASLGFERIIFTDVERDGTLTGPDIYQTRIIARGSGLKVTASGGISSLEDLKRLEALNDGIDSVIVGKALYEGRFTLQQALTALNGKRE